MKYLYLLLLLFSASTFAGSIHKWVDENGDVNYGDSPPAQTKTQPVRVSGPPSNTGKALPKSVDPKADTNRAGNVPADQAKIACDQAKADLKVIKNSSRVKLKQADGTERYLTTEEIGQRRDDAAKDVDQFCQ
ncbi:MAG: hypothetical protein ACI845_001387 [Gammaproteobacteria bacterium]|jgi:hypothetical protein